MTGCPHSAAVGQARGLRRALGPPVAQCSAPAPQAASAVVNYAAQALYHDQNAAWHEPAALLPSQPLAGCGKRLKHRPAGTQTKVCATGYQSLTSTWWHRLQPVEAFFRSLPGDHHAILAVPQALAPPAHPGCTTPYNCPPPRSTLLHPSASGSLPSRALS